MTSLPRIAFLGLGNMGGPMAANLHRAGYPVRAFDLSATAMTQAREAGVTTVDSARSATDGAGVVISMLPASRHVEALYLGQGSSGSGAGDDGLLAHLAEGALIIDCSTIAPASAQKVAAQARARGLAMLDAPVSGGVAGATAGTLTFIVGGTPVALERARPVLQAMGRNIFHMGESGAGQVAKLCNNMALGVIMAATGEAIALGVAHGLDPKALSAMMAVSTSRSWATEVCNPWPGVLEAAPASRGYQGGFGNDLMLKDLGLAVEAAMGTGATIPLGELARNLYALNRQAGRGALDFSSVVQVLTDRAAGPPARPPVAPFVITREFRAPRALLWQVQTQARHLQHWLSPEGFHTIHADMDFRVGGRYHYGLEGPNGMQMWGLQQFLEMVPEQKLVHLQSFSDPSGGLGRHPMAADWPTHMHVTATWEDSGNGNTIHTLTWQPHESDDRGIAAFDRARAGMEAGFAGTFAKLDAYLRSLQG